MGLAASPPSSPHYALIRDLSGSIVDHGALERAIAQLSRGGDLALVLATAKALGRAGLAEVGRRVLRIVPPAIARSSDASAIQAELNAVPDERVPRDILDGRFAQNMAKLTARQPDLAATLAEAKFPHEEFLVLQTPSSAVHVLRTNTTRLDFVFPFVDQIRVAASTSLPHIDLNSAIACIGVPSESLLRRLASLTVNTYQPPIEIFEPDKQILLLWLGLVSEDVLGHNRRVSVFAGENAVRDYSRCLVDAPTRAMATCVLTNHRPGWVPPRLERRTFDEIVCQRQQRQHRLRDSLRQRLGGRTLDDWRSVFTRAAAGHERLSIVGFTSRYSTVIQHAMRDLIAAFARLGHSVQMHVQPDDCSAAIDVAGALCEGHVDFVLVFNHLRLEFADSIPPELPIVAWIQDHLDHLWCSAAGASIGECDLVITHSPDVLSDLYGYPRDRMLPSSNLTDATVYSHEPLSECELAPYRCDVSYVGHGSGSPESLVEEITQATTLRFGSLLREFLTLARSRIAEEGCLSPQRIVMLLLEAEQRSGHPKLSPDVRRATVYPQVARLHDRIVRHEALEWAADWARSRRSTFRIYGSGWERHASLGQFAAGKIANGHPLRALHQASIVNLQINGYSSLHQRLLDALASGGFVLSRWNPADFVRAPFLAIRRAIHEHDIRLLAELVRRREVDEEFERHCRDAERLSGAIIRERSHPLREAQVKVLCEANPLDRLQTDAGLLEMLRDMRFLPARVAAELPGMEHTVFRTRQEMHELLDRFRADPQQREAIASRMREAVLSHDTTDALARRIIRALAGWESAPCDASW